MYVAGVPWDASHRDPGYGIEVQIRGIWGWECAGIAQPVESAWMYTCIMCRYTPYDMQIRITCMNTCNVYIRLHKWWFRGIGGSDMARGDDGCVGGQDIGWEIY